MNWTQKLTITNVGSAADTFLVSVQPVGGGPAPSVSTNTLQLAPGQSQDIGVQFAADHLAGGVVSGICANPGYAIDSDRPGAVLVRRSDPGTQPIFRF